MLKKIIDGITFAFNFIANRVISRNIKLRKDFDKYLYYEEEEKFKQTLNDLHDEYMKQN